MKTTSIFSKLPVISQELFEDSLQEQICISQIWRPGIWFEWMYFHAVFHWILDVVLSSAWQPNYEFYESYLY